MRNIYLLFIRAKLSINASRKVNLINQQLHLELGFYLFPRQAHQSASSSITTHLLNMVTFCELHDNIITPQFRSII